MIDGDGTETILDFESSGSFTDLIDIHRLLDNIDYTGTMPIADGVVILEENGDDVNVQSSSGFSTVAIVENTDAAVLNLETFFVTTDTCWFGT